MYSPRTDTTKGDVQLLEEIDSHIKAKNCGICLKHYPSTSCQELIRKISYTSSAPSNAPQKLQVLIHGEVSDVAAEKGGVYILQDRLINGFPFWIETSQNNVIWYNKIDDHWSISLSKDLGTSEWSIAGQPQNDTLPHLTDTPWRYKSESDSKIIVDNKRYIKGTLYCTYCKVSKINRSSGQILQKIKDPASKNIFMRWILLETLLQTLQSFIQKLESVNCNISLHVLNFNYFFSHLVFSVIIPYYLTIITGGSTKDLGSDVIPECTRELFIIPNLPKTIFGSPSLCLHDGSILLCGGYGNLKDCFYVKNGKWTWHSQLNVKRTYASVVSTEFATFIFGGFYSQETYEFLDKKSSVWQTGLRFIPDGFWGGDAVAVSQERIILVGGKNTQRRILSFDVTDHTFEELDIKLIEERLSVQCACIPGTKNNIIITGGLKSTEILNLETNNISIGASMKKERFGHGIGTFTKDGHDRIIVFGGQNVVYEDKYDESVEVYDHIEEKWELTNSKLGGIRFRPGVLTINTEHLPNLPRPTRLNQAVAPLESPKNISSCFRYFQTPNTKVEFDAEAENDLHFEA